jgi:hypothetical protein
MTATVSHEGWNNPGPLGCKVFCRHMTPKMAPGFSKIEYSTRDRLFRQQMIHYFVVKFSNYFPSNNVALLHNAPQLRGKLGISV